MSAPGAATRRKVLALTVAAIAAVAAIVVLAPRVGSPVGSQGRTPPGPIQHVVEVMLENHAFDNFFGTFPGADGLPNNTSLPDGHGGSVAPYWISGDSTSDLPHDRASELRDLDGGKMDGFVEEMAASGLGPADTPMGYYNGTQLSGFWALAHQFVLCDEYFASVLGPTVPNRLYAMAGASAGVTSDLLPPDTTLYTVFDQLTAYGFSWAYYYDPSDGPALPMFLLPLGADPREVGNLEPLSSVLGAAASGGLPAVTFVDPEASIDSEHPPLSVIVGEAWTVELIDAIEAGPEWNSTVVFLTWDEGGGYYDHVVPPSADGLGDGFRVPMIVISPFAGHGAVDATVYDHTSVLKFLENAWGLPLMTSRIAAADNLCSTLLSLPASERCAAFGPALSPLASSRSGGVVSGPPGPGRVQIERMRLRGLVLGDSARRGRASSQRPAEGRPGTGLPAYARAGVENKGASRRAGGRPACWFDGSTEPGYWTVLRPLSTAGSVDPTPTGAPS